MTRGSLGVDWVDMWHNMLSTNDLVNANTGLFDPRHMFGLTNQDVSDVLFLILARLKLNRYFAGPHSQMAHTDNYLVGLSRF